MFGLIKVVVVLEGSKVDHEVFFGNQLASILPTIGSRGGVVISMIIRLLLFATMMLRGAELEILTHYRGFGFPPELLSNIWFFTTAFFFHALGSFTITSCLVLLAETEPLSTSSSTRAKRSDIAFLIQVNTTVIYVGYCIGALCSVVVAVVFTRPHVPPHLEQL